MAAAKSAGGPVGYEAFESNEPPATDVEAARLMEELTETLKHLEDAEHATGVLVSPDDRFTSFVQHGPQDTTWRKLDFKHLVPGGLILEGPNPYIPGHVEQYGPHGYMTLEFSEAHLNEVVHAPDGSIASERQLV